LTRLVERGGATVHGNEATREGELMQNIADAFAQYERALISIRTRTECLCADGRPEMDLSSRSPRSTP
jgi:hypothetical protein